MNVILPDDRLICCEQVILLIIWPRCVRMAQRLLLYVLILSHLLWILVQKLINVPSTQGYVLLRLLVPFSLPQDQESQKIGLNHVIKVPPNLRLQWLILAFNLQILQKLGGNLLGFRNEFHRFDRVFLVMKGVVSQNVVHKQAPLPRVDFFLLGCLQLEKG